jgi:ABC-type polysaccharide/polyol phosphate transport system ATPase subunit
LAVSLTLRERETRASVLGQPGPVPAIRLEHVDKSFKLPHDRFHTLKQRALYAFRNRTYDVLRAVDDVSVEIATGEFFGIVGRNGSGKSTLLKCLAGIYATESGRLEVHGRLAPFIELGVGFNPELTARDNAIINAVMLGLSRREAERRFPEIVAFAELEEFMDLKLKNYSSGMLVRLAFSVAIQVDADILLIDEVLAVGDVNFQQKCFDQFTRFKESGRTIVFVTHDMGSVERFCDRAMLMDRGKVIELADPASIARRYNELNFRRVREEAVEQGGPEVLRRTPVAELRSAWFESLGGEKIVEAAQGGDCCVAMEVRFHQATANPIFAVALHNELGHTAFAASTQVGYGPTGEFAAGELAEVRLRFSNWLGPGRYRLTASVTRDGTGADAFDLREDVSSLIVHTASAGGGTVDLPHRFEIQRS